MLTVQFEEKKLLYLVQVKSDADAFGQLYNRYIEKIYRFVFFKVSSRPDAEDITSDIFLKAWNYLRDPDRAPVDHFSGFIYQIARNTIIDWYRQSAKRTDVSLEAASVLAIDSKKILSIRGEMSEVFVAMARLKHEYQELILLRHIEDMSIGEIADITGKGQVAVRVTLHRAMKKLREILDQNHG